jgi:hypothetical protein
MTTKKEVATAAPVVPALPEGATKSASLIDIMAPVLAALLQRENPNMDAVDRAMAMAERLEFARREQEFKQAFAVMWPKLPQIAKKGDASLGGKGGYKYVREEDVMEECKPIMEDHGFGLSAQPVEQDLKTGTLTMEVELIFRNGFSKRARMSGYADAGPGRNALQAMGSAQTYLTKYLTKGLLALVQRGADDDGNRVGLRESGGDYMGNAKTRPGGSGSSDRLNTPPQDLPGDQPAPPPPKAKAAAAQWIDPDGIVHDNAKAWSLAFNEHWAMASPEERLELHEEYGATLLAARSADREAAVILAGVENRRDQSETESGPTDSPDSKPDSAKLSDDEQWAGRVPDVLKRLPRTNEGRVNFAKLLQEATARMQRLKKASPTVYEQTRAKFTATSERIDFAPANKRATP